MACMVSAVQAFFRIRMEEQNMAARKTNGITVETEAAVEAEQEPTVRIFIPKLEDQESDVEVDQTEYVTINGVTTAVKRGEYVDVKVPVFMQLKQRYPNI